MTNRILKDLRGHVVGRARHALGHLSIPLRSSKVAQFRNIVCVNHNILRFHITMNNAMSMQILQTVNLKIEGWTDENTVNEMLGFENENMKTKRPNHVFEVPSDFVVGEIISLNAVKEVSLTGILLHKHDFPILTREAARNSSKNRPNRMLNHTISLWQ